MMLSKQEITVLIVFLISVLVFIFLNKKKLITKLKNLSLPTEPAANDFEAFEIFQNITFEQITNFNLASASLHESQTSKINFKLKEADSGLQIIEIIVDKDTILASFDKGTQRALDLSDAALVKTKDGKEILIARDLKTGKFRGVAKKADARIHNLTQVANLVVGAAHIISGYDNAKNLNIINKNVSKILQFRSADMVAELKAIYETLQGLSFNKKLTHDKIMHLRSLQLDLQKLRNKWMSEVISGLNSDIKNPLEFNWFKRTFSLDRRSMTTQKATNKIEKCIEPLYLVRVTLEFERMISVILNEREIFEKVCLGNTIIELTQINDTVKQKREWLDKYVNDGGMQVSLLLEGTESLIDSLKKTYK